MQFAFTDDQLLFRDTVRALLEKVCTADAVRECWVDEHGRLPAVWMALAEMGVLGLTVPEQHSGLAMGELDLVLLLEETGRAALPDPVVDTVAVAAPLLADHAPDELRREWLPRIAGGDAVVVTRLGLSPFVLLADQADLVVAMHDDRLVAVPGAAIEAERQASVDGARRLFTVGWDARLETVLASGVQARAAGGLAFDRGALATAAQLVGLADHLVEATVDHVKEREQFGVPIGSFQAIKHRLADAVLAIEFARPVVYRAAYSLASVALDPSARARDVSMAKCFASDAAVLAARTALQCHGAIGYTVEHSLHLWMKRVWALAAAWGDAAWHRERVALSVLGPGPQPYPALGSYLPIH